MAFDVESARKAGYSEAEIVDFLGNENKFDVKAARASGYTDTELVSHLTAAPTPQVAKPVAPAAPAKGIGQRIDESLDEGKANFNREIKNPISALGKLALGAVRGVSDIAEGGIQFGANNVRGAVRAIAPDSTLVKKMDEFADFNAKKLDEAEAKYQDLTKGSVFAGGGRVVGNVVAPGGAVGKTATAASMAARVGKGALTGAAVGAMQPVRGEDRENYAQTKGAQIGIGALTGGAIPIATKGVLETASKLGSTKAEQVLTNQRSAQLFTGKPSAKNDAEVITELGGVNARIGDRKMLTGELNARSKKLAEEAQTALKAAGSSKEELAMFRNWQGLTEAERAAMANTPTGKAAAAIVEKLDRIRGLTPGELSTRNAAVVRGALDWFPMPTAIRNGLRTTLGGRVTRAEQAEKLMDPRTQRAAAQYLDKHGASEATQGLNTLKGMAQAKVDAKAALERAKAAAKAKADAAKAADAEKLSALTLKGRKISGTPGGGAYQTLLEHTGLSSDNLNKALRVAQRIPEAADDIRRIRVDGGNTKDGALYPITDMLKSIADDMGMPRGALTQAQPSGALTGATEAVTAKYQMATKVRQGIYDKAQAKAKELTTPEARNAADEVAGKLKSTPKRTERLKLIDDLETAHPETKGLFKEVRNFN